MMMMMMMIMLPTVLMTSLGTVPIYMGDTDTCRKLLPRADAAIYFSDFNESAESLASYLRELIANASSYELHRSRWRQESRTQLTTLGFSPWKCDVCAWAAEVVSRSKRNVLHITS